MSRALYSLRHRAPPQVFPAQKLRAIAFLMESGGAPGCRSCRIRGHRGELNFGLKAGCTSFGRSLTNRAQEATINKLALCEACGPVAQLGARFHGMEEVVGSIPTRSTNKPLINQ